jgi:hypothetical protein
MPVTAANAGEQSAPQRPAVLTGYRITTVMVLAAIVLAVGFDGIHDRPLRAAKDPQRGSIAPERSAVAPDSSGTAIDRRLLERHAASARLAGYMLARVDEFERLEGQATERAAALKKTRAAYETARSARAAAENAVTEYEQGTARLDEAKVSGEMFEAWQNLERTRNNIQEQTDKLAQLRATSKDAIAVLAASILTKQRLRVAESRVAEAAEQFEDAESRLHELLEKTKPSRVKDLRATVETRKAEELELKARWELEQSQLARLQLELIAQAPTALERRVLALLDRAIELEDQIQARLGPLATLRTIDPGGRREIDDLFDRLATIVEEAELAAVAAENARLKPRIQKAARRYPAAPLENPTVRGGSIARSDR